MRKLVVFAAGGTGGHVLPAQAVAESVEKAGFSCAFIAHGLHDNQFFDRLRWPWHTIAAAPILFHPIRLCQFFWKTGYGMIQAYRRLHGASLVVGFGSYHSVPVLLAAILRRIPFILYEANTVPGRVIRLFSRWALWTGCCFPTACRALSGNTVVVQHPIRSSCLREISREQAQGWYQLSGYVVLVIGGSQGAVWLNQHVPKILGKLAQPCQVLHLAGPNNNCQQIEQAYRAQGIQATVLAYEPEMIRAYRAADMVIARAGASVIAEVMALDIPTIYVPYRLAMDNHQYHNALAAIACSRACIVEESQPDEQFIAAIDRVAQMSAAACMQQPSFSELLIKSISKESL